MNCPKCNSFNDDNNAICIICGEIFRSPSSLPPTIMPNISQTDSPTRIYEPPVTEENEYVSEPTVYGKQPKNFNQPIGVEPHFNPPQPEFNPSAVNFNPSIPFIPPSQPPKSRLGLLIGAGVFLLILISCGIIGAILYFNKTPKTTEALPDHLGLFFQNKEKTSVEEIKKQDFTNALEGRDKILKDESMPALESKPNVILFSDGKDIPLADLKLIQMDSIKSDGKMKQLDFKATPVEGKTEMKRLWLAENLAKGKYAFALLDGFLDDGKHKFWVFQVKESDRTDNSSLEKEVTVPVKNKSKTSDSNTSTKKETPKPSVTPPVGARTAYAGTNNIVIRAAPSLSAQKIGNLRRGQKVYVISYSDNYDSWNGLEGTWANVQTESGQRGWVFSPLLSY